MRTEIPTHVARPLVALAVLAGLAALAPAGAQGQVEPQAADTPAAALADTVPTAEPAGAAGAPGAAETADPERPWGDPGDRDRVSILGGNRTVAEGETVGDVLVVGGNLNVRGDVLGDAVVVGGHLILEPTGRIRGDVVVAGGRFRDRGGAVSGEVRTMERVRGVPAATREATAERTERRQRSASPFGQIGRGFAGLISTLALAVVIAAVGAVLVFYGFRYLETVSDTLRASTLRSGGVGLAAAFLIVPAFVVLVVALAVSIVGIPVLILAIPLYPLAIAAAMIFGLIAAAYAIGERTSEQRSPYDMRHRNAYAYLATGLVILFAPVAMGHLVGMTPFLGWLGGLIKFFAYAVIWVATIAGLGAVILSRGGTRRTFARTPAPPDESILEEDPFLDGAEV